MGLFGRKSEIEKRLGAAKVDLAAANAKLAVIATAQGAAAETSEKYAVWRTERAAALDEVRRLSKLIAALQSGAEDARAFDEQEALRKRVAAARKLNLELAERMRTDGIRLSAELLKLVSEVSAACLEADAVNKIRAEGEPAVMTANAIARGTARLARKNVSEKTIRMWVRADNGVLIGDQNRVEEIDDNTGSLHVDRTHRVACVRRKYREISFHPDETPPWLEDLHSLLRLPRFDGAGLAFDGACRIIEHAAIATVEPSPPVISSKREIRTELMPAEPMPEVRSETQIELERLHGAQR